MRIVKFSFKLLIVLASVHLVLPYIAVWHLKDSIERGNIQALSRGVDWKAVRDGLKEDISDGIIDPVHRHPVDDGSLPPFGASFARGIAETQIDREVTPEKLVPLLAKLHSGSPDTDPLSSIEWAFFETPTVFMVTIRGPSTDEGHLRLRLVMRGGKWLLVRIWAPQDMIERIFDVL